MHLCEFDYDLPAAAIAQRPLARRDASRMLLLDRATGRYEDSRFIEFPEILRGDELIVVNNARVIPARLYARRVGLHAQPPGKHSAVRREFLRSRIEVLLVRRLERDLWEALVRPGRKVRTGECLTFEGGDLTAEIVGRGAYGVRQLRFQTTGDPLAAIERVGHIPLPPYIKRGDEPMDRERYQTIFAERPVAVAAPTAGLHFTPAILARLRERKVEICEITLAVGLGTFQPLRTENLDAAHIHSEGYEIPEASAAKIAAARRAGRPVLAIGTTVVRALEDAAQKGAALGLPPGAMSPGAATADLFIRPGHRFALVDQMLTNFHLPRSTLLVLVAAFAGRDAVLAAYRHGVATGYRFYSYGDCMLVR
jgi:S-adenosylmethionine:tRNA ribosyltransferase-isomerase